LKLVSIIPPTKQSEIAPRGDGSLVFYSTRGEAMYSGHTTYTYGEVRDLLRQEGFDPQTDTFWAELRKRYVQCDDRPGCDDLLFREINE